jgi:hypothetical protein
MPSARWPIPYMPGGHFLEESVRRGTPRVICTTHIVDHRWCAAGERVVLSGLCQASCMAVRRVQRSVSYCSTVVAPLLPNSPEGMGGRLAEVFPLIGSFLCVDLRVHLDLRRRRLQLPHLGNLSDCRKVAPGCALEDPRLLHKEAGFHTAFSTVWLSISSVDSAWRRSARLRITVAGCRGLCRSCGPERLLSPYGGGQEQWRCCLDFARSSGCRLRASESTRGAACASRDRGAT